MANTVAGIHLGPDDHASRPTATAVTAGTLYSCSDHDLIYRSDGSTWSTWADVSSAAGGGRANAFIGSIDALRTGTYSATAGLVAARVYVCKMCPDQDITVTKARLLIANSAGNFDIGIYNSALDTKLGSTGSTASPGNGVQDVNLTGSVALSAGTVYYSAFVTDSTTIDIPSIAPGGTLGYGDWQLYGVESATGGPPLPASLTITFDAATQYPLIWFQA